MSRPTFTAHPAGFSLTSPAGVLSWESSLWDVPRAVFHFADPQGAHDEPVYCALMPTSTCYPDWGSLRGEDLAAWESFNADRIEAAMRRMYRQSFTTGQVAA